MEPAKKEVNKAIEELDKAKTKFKTFEDTQKVPSYFEGGSKEYFTFLTQQVKDRAAELKNREAALKDREAASISLSQLEFQKASSTKPPKRARSGSSYQSTQLSQDSFRKRVVARDKVCVLSKMDSKFCEAAHIIAKCNFTVNDIQAKKLWDQKFPGCCDNPEHRVMDIRNGILLAKWIHDAFDVFELTIRKEGAIYKVETQLIVGSPELLSFNGKTIQFDTDKKHEWPREEFLNFHNECFDDKKALLEAASEEYTDQEYEDDTLAERAESVKKSNIWLEHTF